MLAAIMLVAGVLGLAAVLILAGRRMTSHALYVAIFAGFPVLLCVFARRLDLQAITWFKVFSLCAAILLIHFASLVRSTWRPTAGPAIYALVVLNIGGPAVFDALDGRWFGAAVAGAIIALMPRWNAITYPERNGRAVVSYDIPWLWIVAYTLWNASFVSTAYPAHGSDHIAVLSAPLILSLWSQDRRAWLRHRALTISLYAVMVVAANDVARIPWIPAAGGAEIVHGPLVAAAWILVACDVLVRWRNRPARAAASRASAA
jgi:hypothetical protein